MTVTAVGHECHWATVRRQRAGFLVHRGVVEAYVPAGTSMSQAERKITGQSYAAVDAKDVVGFDRYLVREYRPTGPRKSRTAKRFAPRCSSVTVLNSKEGG